jgi:hypothetical protein
MQTDHTACYIELKTLPAGLSIGTPTYFLFLQEQIKGIIITDRIPRTKHATRRTYYHALGSRGLGITHINVQT